ncbi:hypothetical protein Clacol_006933 [Clathrus columnatus]|uniref:Cytochrome P450 n=1 Tax=Clathrus columnatus TaxID=1419009 RepID=A0AAV5ADH5_9AGAM|nr:hypothetical protein Clacol_006933 [Clathrus columnatus]
MSWTEKYGNIEFQTSQTVRTTTSPFFFLKIGGRPALVIGTHKVAIDLLEKRGAIYSDRPTNIVAKEIMTRNQVIVFSMHDDSWRRLRKASHIVLNHEKARDYHQFQNLEAVLLVKDLNETPELYIRHLHRATTSSLISTLYGFPPCPNPFNPIYVLISELMDTVLDAAAPGRYLVEYFPFLRYLPSSICSWKRHAESVFIRADALFKDLYKQVEKRLEAGDKTPSVTSSLIQDPIHKELTFQERPQTWIQMIWFILSMAVYPDIQSKAQAQIDNIVGRERLPNLEDFERLPYVQALKLKANQATGFPHASSQDDYYEGYLIPKGTDIIVNVWALNHDENVYGPDAAAFRPERYLDESGELIPTAGRETKDEGHTMFGFGRRICVGRHVAVSSMFIQVTCILWCFNITPADDETGKPMSIDENEFLDNGLTIRPLPTIRYKFTPRFPGIEGILKDVLESNGLTHP